MKKSFPFPDCTIVSACFSLSKYNQGSRSLEETVNSCRTLLSIPCYLVMYCNSEVAPLLREIRTAAGFSAITEWRIQELEEIWTYQYRDKVNSNRGAYWPTKDARAGTEVHLVCCNKPEFVLKVIADNPFQTSKFAWLDANLGADGRKISRNWNTTSFLHILHAASAEKFRIQILNVVDKKYKALENKQEYYQQYRWVVCGCLWIGGASVLNKILARVKEIFVATTEAGFGHGEEMLFLEILDEFYEEIDRTYGDYQDILQNFLEPVQNYYYLRKCILARYLQHGYFKEAADAATSMIECIDNYKTWVSAGDYIDVFHQYFLAVNQLGDQSKTKEVAKQFVDLCKRGDLKEEFEKLHPYTRMMIEDMSKSVI